MAFAALGALSACDSDDFVNVITPIATTLTINAPSDGQTGVVGQALATPLSVHVTDVRGNAVAGATVSWAVVGGGGTLSAATSVSDLSGDATIVWTLPNLAGAYQVQASLANGNSVTFNATATAAAATALQLISGDNQGVPAGTATQAMVIRAVDQFGNPVAGVSIAWSTTGGGALNVTSGLTDAAGNAQVTLTTSGAAGPFTVTASSGTLTPIVFNGIGS
jgi:hypothetical protein